ncbi:hypothetical protein O3P69_020492 [Scylla paramamosain]|uniref:Uncharacterized protein n=1 Tax=Scylla paramamosain TaxID=85552 RepID=A0AAW0TPE5_SCYPA
MTLELSPAPPPLHRLAPTPGTSYGEGGWRGVGAGSLFDLLGVCSGGGGGGRSPMEQAGVLGAVRGRDGNGSYPDIHSWFVRGSGCRRWWQSAEDRRKDIHR